MKRIITTLILLLAYIGFSQNPVPLVEEKIKIARKLAKKFQKTNKIQGMAISVSEHGNLIWSEGFGYANRKLKVKVKPNETLFRIASISKSITAVTLAKLVDNHQIDLDKSIYEYLPNYPKKKYDFTVRELGGHLAGIRSYKGNEFVLNKKMTITQGLDLFKNDPLVFEPSSQYLYNSLGYVLLSNIMQKASHKGFNNLVNETVLKPLHMLNTMPDASDSEIPNRTKFYKRERVFSTPVSNEYKLAGGGFLSTSEDITKFGHELISPKIISEASLSEITTSQRLNSGRRTGYGIGFSVRKTKKGTPKFFHTGGGVGASSILLIYPKEDLVITVLTNLTGVSMHEFGNELEGIFID
ncbi:serine hydrolase domain-containing protein [Mariniflexile ostreae]|uniref:Serine hydrolase domain-containing protein n=1 Tax=Mariniflexile ostreae TaxID=1520892 RepID=A0ABV5FEX8_9FLAO